MSAKTGVEIVELTMDVRVLVRVDVQQALQAAGVSVEDGDGTPEIEGSIEGFLETEIERHLRAQPYIVEALFDYTFDPREDRGDR